MSSSSKKALHARLRRGKSTRAQLVANNLAESIAFQIRATRDARGLTQSQFAAMLGMTQGNLSRLEDPDYDKQTLASLRRVAEALDVALVVRLEPFTKYVDWLSSTPHLDAGLTPDALAVPSFEEEEAGGVMERELKHWTMHKAAPTVGGSTALPELRRQNVRSTELRELAITRSRRFEDLQKSTQSDRIPQISLTGEPYEPSRRST